MRSRSKLICLFVSVFLLSGHGGRLDKQGCHNDRKHGGYHCHRGAKAGQGFKSKNSPTTKNVLPKIKVTVSLSGIPKIIDGDTIRIGQTRIRFHGIDAPESQQVCARGATEWLCGQEATAALRSLVNNKAVHCIQHSKDRYSRIVAVCRAGDLDLNAWMVRNGWAVAYRKYSTQYVPDEEEAKNSMSGLWQGKFIMPWEWRRGVR